MGGSNPSLSAKGIDCVRGRRWWGFILMNDRGGPFDSQHMASRGGTMMKGHGQLVGVTGLHLGAGPSQSGV